jgi:predicted ArsR family transcriptional regulator
VTTEPVEDTESSTRERVLALIVELGPVTAAVLAERLDLTSAAIRRHLSALDQHGQIIEREDTTHARRGRGRPAKQYIATAAAHSHLGQAYADLAVHALEHLNRVLGPSAVDTFAEERSTELRERYAAAVDAAGPGLPARTAALAEALSKDGYAATSRPIGNGLAVQLCQGHCPVQEIATQFPQLCEAETRAFSDLLGVHVQRLATLAGGEHVCTTHIPVTIPTRAEGKRTHP